MRLQQPDGVRYSRQSTAKYSFNTFAFGAKVTQLFSKCFDTCGSPGVVPCRAAHLCITSTHVLHGESNTGQAPPRTPTQRTFQPQEAVQTQRNHTILKPDTPAQKAKYSYKWSHPTPHEADAHTMLVVCLVCAGIWSVLVRSALRLAVDLCLADRCFGC